MFDEAEPGADFQRPSARASAPPRVRVQREPLSRVRALRSLHHTNEIVSHRGTEPDHPV